MVAQNDNPVGNKSDSTEENTNKTTQQMQQTLDSNHIQGNHQIRPIYNLSHTTKDA